MNLKLCIFLILALDTVMGTEKNDLRNEKNDQKKAEERQKFLSEEDGDEKHQIKEIEVRSNELEKLGANAIQNAEMPKSILKKLKMLEVFDETWVGRQCCPIASKLVFEDNCLGFRGNRKQTCMFWKSEVFEENFPLAFFHESNGYKLKRCDIFRRWTFWKSERANVLRLVYESESPIWHESWRKYLKSFVCADLDFDTITLILTQKRCGENQKESENPPPISVSVTHNGVHLDFFSKMFLRSGEDQLQNLLDKSTKIGLETLKNIWGEIDTTKVAKVVLREKRRAAIVAYVVVVLIAAVFSFWRLYGIGIGRSAPIPDVMTVSAALLHLTECLRAFLDDLAEVFRIGVSFFALMALLPPIFLSVEAFLRAKALRKFTKY